MTGYGRAALLLGGAEIAVEVGGVNRRGLEVAVSGPPEWAASLERHVTGWVREFAVRGKVTVSVRAPDSDAGNVSVLSWDAAAVGTAVEKLRVQAEAAGTVFVPDAATLLRLAELHRTRRDALPALEDDAVRDALAGAVRAALRDFSAVRASEGAFLAKDLLARLDALEGWLAQVAAAAAGVVQNYREALFARLAQARLELDLADERVLKEVALFADRCDIAEEITRLRSHHAQFRALLDGDAAGGVGRKLDFFCQEMNREWNTIGSKANSVEITRLVIEGKNELERVREQSQNVE